MTLKTYIYQEVAGHGEITEWVPADVARELLEVLSDCVESLGNEFALPLDVIDDAKSAIKNACGK